MKRGILVLTFTCAFLLLLICFYVKQLPGYTGSQVGEIFAGTVTSNPTLQYSSSGNKPSQEGKDYLRFTKWWQASALFKWEWEKPMEYSCKTIVPMGNWHVCMDHPYTIKPPCIVYSFGISNDWTFDDAMGKHGCEVHCFDPSIGKQDFNRSPNVHFHNLGIAGYDSDTFEARKDVYVHHKQIWKIRRLKSVMEMLGHANKTIDVLKIDVETSEWPTAKDLVGSGVLSKVRQFLIEWHLFFDYPSTDKYLELYNTYMAVKDQGFSTFKVDFHHNTIKKNNLLFQADVDYVNTAYKGK
ncbi:probable methyltransferase-like protein 24 isoform X1 [Haliotis rufescens]|uniref:probable methyltransferase-like protein 24 isoform X1 n=1 Tax=Haliotis rufescens TaxID=6454 RepID=UPI00201EC6CD|nr:probable methyltransferase-like protein 24 isoform X1 [Haliotis rufescens]